MAILARLGVVLGLDSAEFQQGLASADKKLAEFGAKIPTVAAAGAAAFAAMTYEAMKFADELSDTAKANDVTVSSILKLQNALMLSGGEAENAGKMLNSFSNFIDKAATGNEDAQKGFAKMGISLKDLANLSTEDLFNKYAEGLSKIEDTATRAAKANDAFGKAAKGVDFRSFNDELKHGHELSAEYEKSIADAADAWDMLNKSHHEFIANFTGGLGTSLKMMLEYLQDIKGETSLVGDVAKTAMQTIAVSVSDVVFVFQGLNRQLQMTMLLFKSFVPGSDVEGKWSKYIEEADLARAKLDEFQRRAMGGGGGYGGGASNYDDPRRLDRAADSSGGTKRIVEATKTAQKIQQMLDMAKLISGEYKRHLDFNLANLKTQGDMLYMTENQKKVQEAVNKISDDVDKKLDEIQKKREEAAAHGADKSVLKELDNQAQKVRDLGETYKQLTQTEIEGQMAAQQTFEYGWSQALKQYQEDSQNAARFAGDVFNSVTGNMSAAIDNFVRTGKLSFKGFAQSVIQDLLSISMRMQMMQMVASAGGFAGMWSSLSGGKYTPGSSSFVGPMPQGAAADGGMISGPTLVGENGPEIFIPQSSGTVIPNQQMSSMFSSQPQVVYNGPYIANMQAIDTQSAQQFLAKNKTAVYAASQSAARSLPTSR